jgi:alkanesulfonate monooxygenase SsuD/methylene tetrahydromethanopterin reductase-like flavin-dependent oxidoreductase (luciferase family)
MEDTTMTITTSAIKFAYWVPNVSGGLVVSNIEQRTDWSYDYNVRLAQAAERSGFEYALTQIRFTAGYGAENQHESVSFSHALLAKTEKLKVIAAILPGPWKPVLAAKQLATIDYLTQGRIAINVVSGWFRGEFDAIGEPWPEHDERYVRSEEFIRTLKGIWTLTITALMANITNSKITRLNRNLCKNLISKCFKVAVHVPHVIWLRVYQTGILPMAIALKKSKAS